MVLKVGSGSFLFKTLLEISCRRVQPPALMHLKLCLAASLHFISNLFFAYAFIGVEKGSSLDCVIGSTAFWLNIWQRSHQVNEHFCHSTIRPHLHISFFLRQSRSCQHITASHKSAACCKSTILMEWRERRYTISKQGKVMREFQLSTLRQSLDIRVFRVGRTPAFLAGASRRKG